MKWIAITGGIGSGKSTVSEMIQKKGYLVFDADIFARAVVTKGSLGLKQVEHEFGKAVLNSNEELDRKKMAQIIFKDPSARQRLEDILHPLIQKLTQEKKAQAEKSGAPIAFYDIPLLFETHQESKFDKIVVVTTRLDLQKKRLKERNGWSDEEINSRLQNQISLSEKEKKAHFVIQNNGNLEELKEQVEELLLKLLPRP